MYKRQAQDLLRGVEKEAEGIFGKAEGLPGLVQKVQGGEVYVDPVSYTHLDVYKRQTARRGEAGYF